MTSLPDKPLLRPDEVATVLGISIRHVRMLMEQGHLTVVQVSPRVRRVTRTSLERIISQGTSAA